MRLDKITVRNFRGLKDFSMTFAGKTVLVGGTNSGKTTLLDAINLVLNSSFYYGPGLLSEYDFYGREYEKPENQIRIELELSGLSSDEEKYFGDHVEPLGEDGEVVEAAPETGVFDRLAKVLRLHFLSEYRDEEISCGAYYSRHGEEQRVSKADRARIGFQYLGLQRYPLRALSLSGSSSMQRVMRELDIDLREQQRRILAQLPKIAGSLCENRDFDKLLGDLESEFRECAFLADLPDGERCVKYELSELTFSDLNRGVQMFVQAAHSAQHLPLGRQGSGMQNSLLLGLLIYLGKLKANSIVAVDEPELSLHPHAQRYLMTRLANSGFQLVIATHSPAVVECFELADVRLLDHQNGVLRPCMIDGQAVAKATPSALGVLKRKVADAYFSRVIVLVEGDTEEGALLGFNNLLRNVGRGLDLDRQEVTLLNLQGYTESGQLLAALQPLPARKVLLVDNDQEESQYASWRGQVDLLARFPNTPAGGTFEGMVAWQSPRRLLDQAIRQRMQRPREAKHLPGSFKSAVHGMKPERTVGPEFLQQLLDIPSDRAYFESALQVLASWENERPGDKALVRQLYAGALARNKGFRSGFELASLYTAEELPKAVLQFLELVQQLLRGEIEPGEEHVLST